MLTSKARLVRGGLAQQAIGTIGNALLDVKARALGVPVYELFGGPVRAAVPLYWSHCGVYRVRHAATIGVDPITTLDDLTLMGTEVARRGFHALKTNILNLKGAVPGLWLPAYGVGDTWPGLNVEREVIGWAHDQLSALRSGAGPDVDLLLDISWNFTLESVTRLARALADLDLLWLETDTLQAEGLANVRRAAPMPIASLEAMYGKEQYRPFLEARAVDVSIIDVPWNGFLESLKIAHLAAAFGVNIAPHNFCGHLATMMSAHLCAVVPNFRIMEIEVDDVPWKDEMFTETPVIEDGKLVLPAGPGWGIEVNEDCVRAHPPRSAASHFSR
jgi:galactonate dehydratase